MPRMGGSEHLACRALKAVGERAMSGRVFSARVGVPVVAWFVYLAGKWFGTGTDRTVWRADLGQAG